MAGAFLERLLVTLACGSLCDIRPALGIVRCGSEADQSNVHGNVRLVPSADVATHRGVRH